MTYLFRRGKGATSRVMHVAKYDTLGNLTGQAFCGAENFDASCNLPLGRPVCRNCRRSLRRLGLGR